jgi:hypothetical protein
MTSYKSAQLETIQNDFKDKLDLNASIQNKTLMHNESTSQSLDILKGQKLTDISMLINYFPTNICPNVALPTGSCTITLQLNTRWLNYLLKEKSPINHC